MINLNRLGYILLLFGIVDFLAFVVLGITTLIQEKTFPFHIFFDKMMISFLVVGLVMTFKEYKEMKFNPITLIKHTFIVHYDSLMFLALFLVFMIFVTGFNMLIAIKGLIYFAIWSSARK